MRDIFTDLRIKDEFFEMKFEKLKLVFIFINFFLRSYLVFWIFLFWDYIR